MRIGFFRLRNRRHYCLYDAVKMLPNEIIYTIADSFTCALWDKAERRS